MIEADRVYEIFEEKDVLDDFLYDNEVDVFNALSSILGKTLIEYVGEIEI
ncbi:MAG: hypothetical protein GF311_12605 [Candidatus Lokiarchaeota archaeon]|nr:hypothetical protein [Candidatus Lokiarchaeota archaeon]MBD3339909.1 hypothetical protein [Candidatus Lokiarchaeota archaeon]